MPIGRKNAPKGRKMPTFRYIFGYTFRYIFRLILVTLKANHLQKTSFRCYGLRLTYIRTSSS
jgi:hypothetical protein